MQVTVGTRNTHIRPGQFWSFRMFRPRCHANPPHFYYWSPHLFALGGGQGREGGGQRPTTNPAISLQPHICFFLEKDAQIVLKHVKGNILGLLFSGVSHRRKELRLGNLIRLGPLCLNPWRKFFNQVLGDRGRRLCAGSVGRRLVGGGQREVRG